MGTSGVGLKSTVERSSLSRRLARKPPPSILSLLVGFKANGCDLGEAESVISSGHPQNGQTKG